MRTPGADRLDTGSTTSASPLRHKRLSGTRMAYPNIPGPRRAKRPDDTSSQVLSTVQTLVCGRGYLRAAAGSSFCTPADGVVVQMIYCADNGRFLDCQLSHLLTNFVKLRL